MTAWDAIPIKQSEHSSRHLKFLRFWPVPSLNARVAPRAAHRAGTTVVLVFLGRKTHLGRKRY
jgi:hypothetical protein